MPGTETPFGGRLELIHLVEPEVWAAYPLPVSLR